MLTTSGENLATITESKIWHDSPVVHRLARFVTEEAVALMFNIAVEKIIRIRLMRYVVHVHAKGVSRFVSYADFPAIVGVDVPEIKDLALWKKRWYKSEKSFYAPAFWSKFYTFQFRNCSCAGSLQEWQNLVRGIYKVFSATAKAQLEKAGREAFFIY